MKQREISRSSVAERASRPVFFWVFLGISALLFVVSALLTIRWCTGMSMGEMPMPGGWTMSMTWMRMCGQTWLGAATSFLAMWVVMMVAMMLPSLTPVLWRYYQAMGLASGHTSGKAGVVRLTAQLLTRRTSISDVGAAREPSFLCSKAKPREGGSRAAPTQEIASPCQTLLSAGLITVIVGLGYFFVWALIGITVFPIGVALTTIEMRSPALASVVPIAAGVVVLIAGALQFTAWKADRLDCCRAMPRCHRLPTNVVTAWRHGIHLGFHCSCCCAGLTAILLVVGVMDLRAMAVVTAAITVERLAPASARIIGMVVVAAGLLMIVRAITFA